MERTPSPPRRIRTPPAPLHGDNYEPFSPRRSSRVAAQRDTHIHLEKHSPRGRRDITPTAASKRKQTARMSNFTLSPPSSPITSPQLRSPRSSRRAQVDSAPFDSDTDRAAPTPARRLFANMAPGMMPTPAKTPRKRALESETSLSSTARILFPPRPATIDEVVPTPRKMHKMRKTKDLFTLESFARHEEDDSEKIAIYTDSKERIPTHDDDEDNPFVTKKGKAKAKTTQPKLKDNTNEPADREEGLVYIFRGKKIFRKFEDDVPANGPDATQDAEELSANERQLRRQIGHVSHRPLTRSSVKPRLLFKEEIKKRNIENGIVDEEEEAETDIEPEVAATPSKRKGKAAVPMTAAPPATTPPPTARVAKRQLSFETWSRVKSAHSSSSSGRATKKRGGEPLERETDKRARTRPSSSV